MRNKIANNRSGSAWYTKVFADFAWGSSMNPMFLFCRIKVLLPFSQARMTAID
jgi:hypothetical protein